MDDAHLDVYLPEGGRTVREIVEYVLNTLEGYIPDQVEWAVFKDEDA